MKCLLKFKLRNHLHDTEQKQKTFFSVVTKGREELLEINISVSPLDYMNQDSDECYITLEASYYSNKEEFFAYAEGP